MEEKVKTAETPAVPAVNGHAVLITEFCSTAWSRRRPSNG
jgi:hypothetical protein